MIFIILNLCNSFGVLNLFRGIQPDRVIIIKQHDVEEKFSKNFPWKANSTENLQVATVGKEAT